MKHFMDIHREFLDMPETQMMNKIDNLALSFHIFKMNADALLEHIAVYEGPSGMGLIALDNSHILDDYRVHLCKHIHNFTASAMSLIDHTRRFYRKYYEPKSIFADYNQQLRETVIQSDHSEFFQGLRNYIIHVKIPFVGNAWEYTPESGMTRTLFFNSDDLLLFERWNARAKLLIKSAPDGKENLGNASRIYIDIITRFNTWFYHRLNEIHKDDLVRIYEKKSEFRTAFSKELPRLLENDIQAYKQLRSKPESIFINKIDHMKYLEILNTITDPMHRADALLNEIETFSSIPKSTRESIVNLFSDFYTRKAPDA